MVLRTRVAVKVSEKPEWGVSGGQLGPASVCEGPTQKSAEQIFFLRGHTSQLVFLRVKASLPGVEGEALRARATSLRSEREMLSIHSDQPRNTPEA